MVNMLLLALQDMANYGYIDNVFIKHTYPHCISSSFKLSQYQKNGEVLPNVL